MQIWSFAYEHKTQSIFVLLQMIAVIAGMCFFKAISKLGLHPTRSIEGSIIHHVGFLLLAIPPAWAILTIWLERHHGNRYPGWLTFVSGMSLFMYLVWIFYYNNIGMLYGGV